MIKPSDETLMAYADGLLDPSQRAEIEKLCTEDPALLARLQVFRATGRNLAGLLQEHLEAPVPKRLLDFVAVQEAKLAGNNSPSRLRFWTRLREQAQSWLFSDTSKLRIAIVTGVALIFGTGAGWLLHGNSGSQEGVFTDLVQVEKAHLLARAPLQHALDRLRSGETVRLALAGAKDARLEVKMTFRNEARNYCRAYDIMVSSPERYAGVACRNGSRWMIRIQAMMPPSTVSPNQLVPAGVNNAAMESVVSAIIDGDPLSAADEAAIIGKGWKK